MKFKSYKKWLRQVLLTKKPPVNFADLRIITCNDENIEKKRSHRITLHIKTDEIDAYFHKCPIVKNQNYDCRDTNYSIATEKVAYLLGRDELIPHSEYVFLKVGDQEPVFGLLTDASPGESIIAVADKEIRRKLVTPQFQRDMLDVHLLDVINHELDHNPNNYSVVYSSDKNHVVTLSRFDNSGAGTFAKVNEVSFENYKNCSCLINKDGRFNRPFISKISAEKIKNLTYGQIHEALRDTLNICEIVCLWCRIKKLKRAIHLAERENPQMLLDDYEWSAQTISKELSGEYGKTYLTSFIEDCVVPGLK